MDAKLSCTQNPLFRCPLAPNENSGRCEGTPPILSRISSFLVFLLRRLSWRVFRSHNWWGLVANLNANGIELLSARFRLFTESCSQRLGPSGILTSLTVDLTHIPIARRRQTCRRRGAQRAQQVIRLPHSSDQVCSGLPPDDQV